MGRFVETIFYYVGLGIVVLAALTLMCIAVMSILSYL